MKSGNKKKIETRSIDWRMALSHHPPCQYERTFIFLKIRFCTRCCAILFGIAAILVYGLFYPEESIWLPTSSLVLPLPAVLNFTLHELGITRNSNLKRAATGFLLGLSIGIAINYLMTGIVLFAITIIIWIILLEVAVVMVLHKFKVLERFFKQYEEGVYRKK